MVQPDNIRNAVAENLPTFHSIDLNSINQYCQNNPVGKMLPDAFYIHILALHTLDPWLQEYENRARTCSERSRTSALLKVQSAMAIADGVRGFREAIPSIKAFGLAMKAAIGSTGIGLLVVAVGTLAAYWDDIKSAIGGVSSEQQKLNAQAQTNVNIQQKKFDSISGQENILRLQGKTEKQITEMKITQIKAVISSLVWTSVISFIADFSPFTSFFGCSKVIC
jgi:hypothetical protein